MVPCSHLLHLTSGRRQTNTYPNAQKWNANKIVAQLIFEKLHKRWSWMADWGMQWLIESQIWQLGGFTEGRVRSLLWGLSFNILDLGFIMQQQGVTPWISNFKLCNSKITRKEVASPQRQHHSNLALFSALPLRDLIPPYINKLPACYCFHSDNLQNPLFTSYK